jgi:hypothetical protein
VAAGGAGTVHDQRGHTRGKAAIAAESTEEALSQRQNGKGKNGKAKTVWIVNRGWWMVVPRAAIHDPQFTSHVVRFAVFTFAVLPFYN